MKFSSKILDLIPSWLFLQKFYKVLHTISIRGMNYGGSSGKFESTGEINVFKFLRKHLLKSEKDKPIIFDVGANIGSYSEMLLKYLPDNVQIFSFEPSRSTYEILANNMQNTTAKCFSIGFGEEEKELKLYHGENSTQSSLFNRLKRGNDQLGSSESVSIRTIDNFCQENHIQEIFFLKLDIEGNEFNALNGAIEFLKKKKIHHIQFEFGGTNIDSKTFLRDFWYMLKDYELYRIVSNGLLPIKAYNESLEIFYFANYFAKLK